MVTDWLSRQRKLIGQEATEVLQNARVAVIGLGGVGGAALEGLARCGVGALFVMDADVFEPSNRNRQILATTDSTGQEKAIAAAGRVAAINPDAALTAVTGRFNAEFDGGLLAFRPQWVIDAIDSVGAKLELIALCKSNVISIVSSMGTGNRLVADFKIGDIADTVGCGCPLARVMRRELRRRDIADVPVLYGVSPPLETGDRVPGSISFVPPVAGYQLAGYVIRSILGKQ